MDEELNDIEEEMEELEEEIEEEEMEEPQKKSKKPTSTKKKVKVPVQEREPQPTEKYIAVHQEERIGIVDTLTNEWIVEGLSDTPTAFLEAITLNKLDNIEIASGV